MLFPLLFCILLNPLSQIITRTRYGYMFRSGTTISHLLYLDDIKLYAKNVQNIDLLIHLTWFYSEDFGMLFGLENCGWMIVMREKVVKINGMKLPADHIAVCIPDTSTLVSHNHMGIKEWLRQGLRMKETQYHSHTTQG